MLHLKLHEPKCIPLCLFETNEIKINTSCNTGMLIKTSVIYKKQMGYNYGIDKHIICALHELRNQFKTDLSKKKNKHE